MGVGLTRLILFCESYGPDWPAFSQIFLRIFPFLPVAPYLALPMFSRFFLTTQAPLGSKLAESAC